MIDKPLSPAERLKDTVWQQIVRLATTDAHFRDRLQTEPVALLQAVGITVPAGIRFVCVETAADNVAEVLGRSDGNLVYVPIVTSAAPDAAGELEDEALDAVVGGTGPLTGTPMPSNFSAMISFTDGVNVGSAN
ncbi:hypothetical protein [Oceanibaculum sp.]|uniref:hypothetical protein n=1 Tax=Oceanibaculum sp. TaxID=1903597 RepID=UPI00258F9687|nr:hypothetical protein [Oceanibaculum sp.]MCH2394849.1 hypothetical protein [Oceanibaculum sp.]